LTKAVDGKIKNDGCMYRGAGIKKNSRFRKGRGWPTNYRKMGRGGGGVQCGPVGIGVKNRKHLDATNPEQGGKAQGGEFFIIYTKSVRDRKAKRERRRAGL